MPDIICPLLDLPDYQDLISRLSEQGICVRPARPYERAAVSEFVLKRWGQGWVDECLAGFARTPISTLVAVKDKQIIGFAAYEATAPGFFGPTGVDKAFRGQGIGKALLLESLAGLRSLGYVYGFIGYPGPVDFYLKITKGIVLPKEWSNIYTNATGVTACEHKDEG